MESSAHLQSALRILNISFYQFRDLNHLPELRKSLKDYCLSLGIRGTILLSHEGINSSLAGEIEAIRSFQSRILQEFPGLQFKESYSETIPFKKLFVKLKKEIIPVGDPEIQPNKLTAERLSVQELKRWLDEGKEFELLDTRNEYEIEYGKFNKATSLELDHFRDFADRLSQVPSQKKEMPVVMYCTGGIRCEKATAIALKQGFREVYQLEGGILKYFEECGGQHYDGNCFVFDERVALDSRLKPVGDQNESKAKVSEGF